MCTVISSVLPHSGSRCAAFTFVHRGELAGGSGGGGAYKVYSWNAGACKIGTPPPLRLRRAVPAILSRSGRFMHACVRSERQSKRHCARSNRAPPVEQGAFLHTAAPGTRGTTPTERVPSAHPQVAWDRAHPAARATSAWPREVPRALSGVLMMRRAGALATRRASSTSRETWLRWTISH